MTSNRNIMSWTSKPTNSPTITTNYKPLANPLKSLVKVNVKVFNNSFEFNQQQFDIFQKLPRQRSIYTILLPPSTNHINHFKRDGNEKSLTFGVMLHLNRVFHRQRTLDKQRRSTLPTAHISVFYAT